MQQPPVLEGFRQAWQAELRGSRGTIRAQSSRLQPLEEAAQRLSLASQAPGDAGSGGWKPPHG
eukprot:8067770-Alexandrium_andersonii.AAC.1